MSSKNVCPDKLGRFLAAISVRVGQCCLGLAEELWFREDVMSIPPGWKPTGEERRGKRREYPRGRGRTRVPDTRVQSQIVKSEGKRGLNQSEHE